MPGDGTLTITWTVSPRAGEADDDIHHALRWSQTPGVWANPAGPRGHHNDGIVIWGGTATYTITGLTNGIPTGVFVRSFTGTRTGEDSPHTSKWIRIKARTPPPNLPPPQTASGFTASAARVPEPSETPLGLVERFDLVPIGVQMTVAVVRSLYGICRRAAGGI